MNEWAKIMYNYCLVGWMQVLKLSIQTTVVMTHDLGFKVWKDKGLSEKLRAHDSMCFDQS